MQVIPAGLTGGGYTPNHGCSRPVTPSNFLKREKKPSLGERGGPPDDYHNREGKTQARKEPRSTPKAPTKVSAEYDAQFFPHEFSVTVQGPTGQRAL